MHSDSKSIIVCDDADLLASHGPIIDESPNDQRVDDERAWKEELRTPLEKVYADEFQRYYDLFVRYLPKKPFHVRTRYGGGFICQKGRKKNGEEYYRACYPALVARMLDHDRRRLIVQPENTPPNYWIAMNTGRMSTLKAIDFDNKENLLGYYQYGNPDDWSPRPLPVLTLEHLQAVRRLYDAFPGHIWCISSATLGLHAWQKLPRPMPIDAIHAMNRPKLVEIGMGGTEIHPMSGRCFRRPFGEDYFTITDTGLLEHWIDQLHWFENVAQPPSFTAIYQAMRSLACREWSGYLGTRTMVKCFAGKPSLLKYFLARSIPDYRQVEEDLKILDDWADRGFPQNPPISVAVPNNQHPAAPDRRKREEAESASGIDMSAVCDRQWVQNCEMWARQGLPCHDSVFQVVSQLARWFWFIEFWDVPEEIRLEQVVRLMTDFCLSKHNGFISGLNAGHRRNVRKRIRRIVSCAVRKTDDSGKWHFARVRQKRQSGQYRRIIFLEPVIRSESSENGETCQKDNKTPPSPLGLICCSGFNAMTGQTATEDNKTPSSPLGLICWTNLMDVNNADSRRMKAERWIFEPDDTPLPDDLVRRIEGAYREAGRRLFRSTMAKITRFV